MGGEAAGAAECGAADDVGVCSLAGDCSGAGCGGSRAGMGEEPGELVGERSMVGPCGLGLRVGVESRGAGEDGAERGAGELRGDDRLGDRCKGSGDALVVCCARLERETRFDDADSGEEGCDNRGGPWGERGETSGTVAWASTRSPGVLVRYGWGVGGECGMESEGTVPGREGGVGWLSHMVSRAESASRAAESAGDGEKQSGVEALETMLCGSGKISGGNEIKAA